MREVKFRGKRIDNSQWIYGYLVKQFGEFKIYDDSKEDFGQWLFDVDPKTLGQCTGLKDTHGKEIYEGDIVQDADTRLFEVKHGAYTRVDYIGMDKRIRSSGYGWYVQNLYTNQMVQGSEMIYTEVIGNIYKNPELLEIDNK